jgi:GWxTD domain-containing protein
LVSTSFTSFAITQAGDGTGKALSRPYQGWLDEDVRYIITDEQRADFAKLATDELRDKFVEDFWQRRNPNPTPEWNPFKEEHYRRLAYANEQFAASVPGWKTDRGRIYIIYGPPDEREGHPANTNPDLPPDASLTRRYHNEVWRYNHIRGLGHNVFFDFVDQCNCGEYHLVDDPTKRQPRPTENKERMVPVKQFVIR